MQPYQLLPVLSFLFERPRLARIRFDLRHLKLSETIGDILLTGQVVSNSGTSSQDAYRPILASPVGMNAELHREIWDITDYFSLPTHP